MPSDFSQMPADFDQMVSRLGDFLENRLPQEAAAKIQEVIQDSFNKQRCERASSMDH